MNLPVVLIWSRSGSLPGVPLRCRVPGCPRRHSTRPLGAGHLGASIQEAWRPCRSACRAPGTQAWEPVSGPRWPCAQRGAARHLLMSVSPLPQHSIRALALRVLRETLRSQPARFKHYAELTIMKTLEAHKDSHKEVSQPLAHSPAAAGSEQRCGGPGGRALRASSGRVCPFPCGQGGDGDEQALLWALSQAPSPTGPRSPRGAVTPPPPTGELGEAGACGRAPPTGSKDWRRPARSVGSGLSSGSRHGAGRARFWARRVCTQRPARASSSSRLLDCPGACCPQSSTYREMGSGAGGAS